MTLRIGILIFDGAEELDFVGPWEVFTMARALKPDSSEVMLIAERDGPVRCAKGMRVLPDATIENCGRSGCAPGSGWAGHAPRGGKQALAWLDRRKWPKSARWVTSVCTGAMLLDGSRSGARQEGDDPLGLCRRIARARRSREVARQFSLRSGRKYRYRGRCFGRNRHGALADRSAFRSAFRAACAAADGI